MKTKMIILITAALIAAAAIIFLLSYNKTESLPEEYVEFDGVKYKLSFYDDFDGQKLDSSKWSKCPEHTRQDVGGRWGDSMSYLDGGNLVLGAGIKNGTPISGAIRTKNKFEQAKGYFEISCKLQSSPGFWGAFWLMCDEEMRVGDMAKDGAEIDIFESFDVRTKSINHAIHWDGYGEHHRQLARAVNFTDCYDGEFHKFALLWTDTAYIFYIDGIETYRTQEGDSDYPGCCQAETYIKLSVEFGSWAGKYDESRLPDAIVVDYVKAYTSEYKKTDS